MGTIAGLDAPWRLEAGEVLRRADTSEDTGLSTSAARERLARYGPNQLQQTAGRGIWSLIAGQFKSLLVLLLAVAAGLSFVFGEWVEALAIVAVLLINGAVGFISELRAVRSMEALRAMGSVRTRVRRDGEVRMVPADDLVPGDVVLVEGGDVVTADLRLLEASRLEADESALTGESVPVAKDRGVLQGEPPLAERTDMLFKGTAVTRGAGAGVAVATGMDTELGRISALVAESESESTPLERRLNRLGQKLVWVTLLVAGLVAVTGLLAGKDPFLIVETAIALAVATVPEGLPIIATLALARGMRRMARRNALVNRLSAVETLGATNVIFSDKTGTLTENRMTVGSFVLGDGTYRAQEGGGRYEHDGRVVPPADHPPLREAIETGVLCNDASLGPGGGTEGASGDPLEVALLAAGAAAGIRRRDLVHDQPEVREVAFDADLRLMATVHRAGRGFRMAVKGAPEAVLEVSTRVRDGDGTRELDTEQHETWSLANERLAGEGLRVLGLATKQAQSVEEEVYRDLTLVGLVGLFDPPRRDVADAVRACSRAGIRVVMVTGDQPATARNIARSVGLVERDDAQVVASAQLARLESIPEPERRRMLEARVFARISPQQKLDLIADHQRRSLIVAMTGDGVNDAPALKKADIGVAMGMRGTEVARQAADVVLLDDAFSTIVAAVGQGRVIFDNIRKVVYYLLSCNLSEILVVGTASAVNAPLPILPLQILFLNLVTDVFPALSLGMGEGREDVMQRPPRDPGEDVLHGGHWRGITVYGLVITAAVLGAFAVALRVQGMEIQRAVSVSFLTLAFAQLWHAFNMRAPGSRLLFNETTRNPWLWGSLVLCTLLLLASAYAPGLSDILEVREPGAGGWALILGFSLLPMVVGQVVLAVTGMLRGRRGPGDAGSGPAGGPPRGRGRGRGATGGR